MNPWEVVSWIGAVAVSIVIVMLTIAVVFGTVRAIRKSTFDRIVEKGWSEK